MSLLAFSRASKVTPPSLSSSRSHLVKTELIQNNLSLGPKVIGPRYNPLETPLHISPDNCTLVPEPPSISKDTAAAKKIKSVLVHEKQPWLVLWNLLVPHLPEIIGNYYYYYFDWQNIKDWESLIVVIYQTAIYFTPPRDLSHPIHPTQP